MTESIASGAIILRNEDVAEIVAEIPEGISTCVRR